MLIIANHVTAYDEPLAALRVAAGHAQPYRGGNVRRDARGLSAMAATGSFDGSPRSDRLCGCCSLRSSMRFRCLGSGVFSAALLMPARRWTEAFMSSCFPREHVPRRACSQTSGLGSDCWSSNLLLRFCRWRCVVWAISRRASVAGFVQERSKCVSGSRFALQQLRVKPPSLRGCTLRWRSFLRAEELFRVPLERLIASASRARYPIAPGLLRR